MEKRAELRQQTHITRTLAPWVVAPPAPRQPERAELLAAVAAIVDAPMVSIALEERLGRVAVLRIEPLRVDPVLPFPYSVQMSRAFWHWYRRYWSALSEYLVGPLLPGLTERRLATYRRRVLCNLHPLTHEERAYFTRWLLASSLGPVTVSGF